MRGTPPFAGSPAPARRPRARRAGLVLALACGALLAFAASALGGPDPRWVAAAETLSMPVLAPTQSFGMALKRVHPQQLDCGATTEQLDAYYGAGEQRKLTILEGEPFYCGDLGDAPVLGSYRVHGREATLYAYCQGTGCRRATHRYALFWREQGIQIGLLSRGSPRPQLLAIARSMALVEG